jgi:hypothetical protein
MVVGRKILKDLRTSFSFSFFSLFFLPFPYPYGSDGTWCTITDGVLVLFGRSASTQRHGDGQGQLGSWATGARGRQGHGMDRD